MNKIHVLKGLGEDAEVKTCQEGCGEEAKFVIALAGDSIRLCPSCLMTHEAELSQVLNEWVKEC